MRMLLNKVMMALVVLSSVFVLGLFIPVLTTSLVILANNAVSFKEVIYGCVPFYIFTILGWIIAGVYVNAVVRGEIK